MREIIEKELQWLEIIKPVKCFKWAAPIVVGLKPGHKSIRICDGYS